MSNIGEYALKIHYLLVACAGNEVSHAVKEKHLSLEDTQLLMTATYQEWAHNFFDPESQLFPEVDRATVTSDNVLQMKGDGISGVSLWRKYGEVKSYILNHVNPIYLRLTQGAENTSAAPLNMDQVLNVVREELWQVKEENAVRKQKHKKEIQPFNAEWSPKEWLVFICCGFPAGERALSSFTGSPHSSGMLAIPRGRLSYGGSAMDTTSSDNDTHHHTTLNNPTNAFDTVNLLANARRGDEAERYRIAKEANVLLRYDMETRRLEKLIERAHTQKKPKNFIEDLSALLEEHLAKGIPTVDGN